MNRIDVLNIFTKSVLLSLSQELGLDTKKSWSKDQIIETFTGQNYQSILEKMTVEQLEIVLDEVQLSKTGKKADLIQRIVEHETKEVHHKKPVVQQNTKKIAKSATTKRKKCPACNSEQAMNAKFCNQCGNKFPKSEKEIQKCYQEWVREFLEEKWKDEPAEPYQALIAFSGEILTYNKRTNQVQVNLAYRPMPDDEGTYMPQAQYSIETPVGSYSTWGEDPLYGDISRLDYAYSGPSISSILSKLEHEIEYTDRYDLDFVVNYDASYEQKIQERYDETGEVPFSLYAKCFSFTFS